MICRNPNCAKENPDDLIFCKYCGRRLKQPKDNSKKPLIMLVIAGLLVILLIFTKVLLGLNKEQVQPPVTPDNVKNNLFGQKNLQQVDGIIRYNFVFVRGEEPSKEVYLNKDDGSIIKLTNSNATNQYPSISPDRKMVAFERKDGSTSNIYVINSDGTGEKKVAEGHQPTWTNDGSKIIFYNKNPNSISNIMYSIKPDGTNREELISNQHDYHMARYSPDGNKIALSRRSIEGWGIYTVGPDLSGTKTLSISSKEEGEPSWSPDGSKIAFSSQRDGNSEIYAVDLNKNITRLTNNRVTDFSPSFTFDSKIIFAREETGNTNIYIIDDSGENERLLLKNASYPNTSIK